jgi:hypothetical protein
MKLIPTQMMQIMLKYKVRISILVEKTLIFSLIDKKLASLSHIANFAYDPVNFDIFEKQNIIEFFLDQLYLNDCNTKEFEFALGGLCNICSCKLINLDNYSDK